MKSEKTISGGIRSIKRHYWGNILFLILLFLAILFHVIPLFGEGKPVSVTLERYAIMIPIIIIPLSLKYFANQVKRAPRPMGPAEAVGFYKKNSYLRLYILSVVTLSLEVLFGYSRNMNFFWFTVVMLIVFLFCKPSWEELESLTEKSTEEARTTGENAVAHEENIIAPEEDVQTGDRTNHTESAKTTGK